MHIWFIKKNLQNSKILINQPKNTPGYNLAVTSPRHLSSNGEDFEHEEWIWNILILDWLSSSFIDHQNRN